MSDYKTMYLSLFNSVTDAIEILKSAQTKCEEIYLQSENDTPFLSALINTKKPSTTQKNNNSLHNNDLFKEIKQHKL